jgi:hypothetical protein
MDHIEDTLFTAVTLLLHVYSLLQEHVIQKWPLFTESTLSNGSIRHITQEHMTERFKQVIALNEISLLYAPFSFCDE